MPCEGCHLQFTVFKRKRSCNDCKRYYCYNCLVNNNNNRRQALCKKCLVFSKRPLVRSDLLKLKPKDLIFYLQSKHISTAGCVEKEELIDLVLQYVNKADMNKRGFSGSSGSSSGSSSHHTTPQHQCDSADVAASIPEGSRGPIDNNSNSNNSFESIKQTCQNFFSALSDNISDSLANLESRACSKNRPSSNTTVSSNVTEQPRITTRIIPTYASSQQNSSENTNNATVEDRSPGCEGRFTSENLVVNLPSISQLEEESNLNSNKHEQCNCSDEEEIITSFNGRNRSLKSEFLARKRFSTEEQDSLNNTVTKSDNNCAPSTSLNASRRLSQGLKLEICVNDEESSHSSFEELGAIGGGISDDSKTTTDTTSNITDQWQMVDLKINETEAPQDALSAHQQKPNSEINIDKSTPAQSDDSSENKAPALESIAGHINQPPPTPTHIHPKQRVKKVTRRRSESFLNRRIPQASVDDDDEDVNNLFHSQQNRIEEELQASGVVIKNPTQRLCCARCGKSKANIRQQVEKMRQHLESSQMSEIDIKQELTEFLVYLEQRTKSFDYSDSEAGVSTTSVRRYANEINEEQQAEAQLQLEEQLFNRCAAPFNESVDNKDGTCLTFFDKHSRFINLDDIDSMYVSLCFLLKKFV